MSEARKGRARPPFSEEWKSKISEARTDSELHTMVHDQYGTLTALRSYFKITFGVDTAAFSRVLNGKSRSCKGWRLPT